MYIESLELDRIKTFVGQRLDFVHPDQQFRPRGKKGKRASGMLPQPLLPNVNLILGDNGAGKSTVLRAIAMSVLGPSFSDAKLPAQGLVRRGPASTETEKGESRINSTLLLHAQDGTEGERLSGGFAIQRMGELERITYCDSGGVSWNPVFESRNPAFFSAGYGATRRVEPPENLDSAARTRSTFLRGQRLQGLFTESFTLIPLETWLPAEKSRYPKRYREIEEVLNRLLKPGAFHFSGEQERGVGFLFDIKETKIPFRWLSDGYRAFIGWAGDLLYHAAMACQDELNLVDLCGVVMVDDIDLQLHPRWQMKVIKAVADAFPRMQFIFTSHSPLVAGSVEWMNILTLRLRGTSNRTSVKKFPESIHGLDADQVLVSSFFGLSTTRAQAKVRQLDQLTYKAALGNHQAAEQLITKLAEGLEEDE